MGVVVEKIEGGGEGRGMGEQIQMSRRPKEARISSIRARVSCSIAGEGGEVG